MQGDGQSVAATILLETTVRMVARRGKLSRMIDRVVLNGE